MTVKGEDARIVFVRNKHKKDWLALLCTNIELPEADVVRIYGKRWDIEVFFRTAKQHLGLEKGCQARDFDAMIATRASSCCAICSLLWSNAVTMIRGPLVCFSTLVARRCATLNIWGSATNLDVSYAES